MKTILCFGDSNTYGYQPETKKRYDETTRWTCLLQQAIQPYGWRVVEEGLCGRTTNLNGIRRENRNGAADAAGIPCTAGCCDFDAGDK